MRVYRETRYIKNWRGESLRIYISTSFWRRFNPFLACKSCESCESTEKRAIPKAGEENLCESTSLRAFCNGLTNFWPVSPASLASLQRNALYQKLARRVTANLHLYLRAFGDGLSKFWLASPASLASLQRNALYQKLARRVTANLHLYELLATV